MYTVQFGSYTLPMVRDLYNWFEEYVEIMLDPKQVDMETLHEILSNKSNLSIIKIFDDDNKLVAISDHIFTEYDSLNRIPQYTVCFYNEFGVREKQYVDVIVAHIKKPTSETSIRKMQSDMEYIAIMADIDIDEEE